MIQPKISIVIPLYNTRKYIATCIDSILAQTFTDFELIVIDDRSTDGSLEIVQRYSDPRVKIFQQIQNSGESDSRNLGLKIAKGKYIYFMDHDDVILSDTLEVFYNAAEESGAEVVLMSYWYDTHDENFSLSDEIQISKNSFKNPKPRILPEDLGVRLQKEYIDFGIHVYPWIRIQRREFLFENQIYFPEVEMRGDVLFHFAELCLASKIQVINGCGYIYRKHPEQTMKLSAGNHFRKAILSLPTALDFVRDILNRTSQEFMSSSESINFWETKIIYNYFHSLVLKSYRDELTIDEINSILRDILMQEQMFNPDLMRVIINSLSYKMLEVERIL
ncbi:MAG: glycosyltransferase family 2 protein [Selenomonadaceae bacterium]|nr:glycosyltransferase family 2 protein [Selenomonadaceae bacterium]